MKIVVLDGYVLNPGDLSWDGLQKLGNCTIYDRTPPELTIERANSIDFAYWKTPQTELAGRTLE